MLRDYCIDGKKIYSAIYSHNRGTEDLIINDTLLTDNVVGEQRAIAELIEGAYTKRWVNLTTTFIEELKQNDIISFNGILWIVKEISLSYKPPELIQSIKGVRYD